MLGRLTGISYNGTLRHEYRYSATANDGRITSYKNWQSGEDVEYQYDSLGRLAQAQTVGPQWGQAFSYDGFGNLVAKSVTKGSAPVLNVTANAATNRLNVGGMTYDANGNVTAMPGVGAMTYDGRNRYNGSVTGLTPSDFGYDPSNRRIWRKVGDEIEVDFFLPGGEKLGTYATFLHNGHGQDGSNEAEMPPNFVSAIWWRKARPEGGAPVLNVAANAATNRATSDPQKPAKRVSASPNSLSSTPMRSMMPRYRLHNLRLSSPDVK